MNLKEERNKLTKTYLADYPEYFIFAKMFETRKDRLHEQIDIAFNNLQDELDALIIDVVIRNKYAHEKLKIEQIIEDV